MAILHKNITAAADIHNPKWFSGADNGDYAFKNEKGELESTDELLLPSALNFVDGSVAPPTTNSGDIYILSSGGSVNAGWGSVALQDWVRYDGSAWNSITPQKSSLCYDKTADELKVYDGAAWAAIGGGGASIYTSDGTLSGDREVTFDNNDLNFETGSNGLFKVDDTATIGKINFAGQNRAIFSHKDYATTTQYSLQQSATGFTLLNTFTGKQLQFTKENNTVYGKMTDAGKWILGGGSFIGSESISIQGSTFIQGAGTSTGTTLALFDNDSIPNKIFEVLDNGNVDIHANWRANEGSLKINSNNQSFVGVGLTDTTNGYYGGFFWRPTTSYLTIGSNTSGFAIEPTANSQDFVFTSSSFTSENKFVLNNNQEVNANWVASKGTININSSNQSFSGFGLTDTVTGYMGFFGYRPTNDYFVIESTSAISGISFNTNGNNRRMTITDNGLNISNLPTSASGLSSGDVYNDSGTLKIV